MRLRTVFRYELAYRLRSPSTWIYAAFLLFMGFVSLGAAAESGGGDAVHVNAAPRIAHGVVLFGGLFGLLVSAALFGDAAIRDVADGMDPLLYTTRLRKAEYLGGRYLATLAVNAIVVVAIPLGNAAATMVRHFEPDALGPLRLAAYVQPLLLFLLPNLVLVGAILFAIGTLTRQAIPVYLGAAGFFIGYIVAANYWNGIESPMLSTLCDPLGINALLALTRYWTPAERNARLVGFPPMMLWNRVLWLAIASGVLAVLHRRFRFAHAGGEGRGRARRAIVDAPPVAPSERQSPLTVPRIAGVFGSWTRVRQMLAVARQSLTEVMSGRAFPVAFIAAIGLVLLWGWNVGDTVFDTSTWPVTHLVVAKVLSERSIIIPWLVIALYAGELVWKNREVGAAEIADAMPVPTGNALGGRFLALVAIIVAFHAAFMVGGILLQALQGYYRFELGLYVRVLFGLNLVHDVLLAALAMTVHVLVNQKYVGHIVALVGCVLGLAAGPLGWSYLAVFDSGPRWTYTDMNGFGPFLRPWTWFKLYWAAWALLLGVVAVLFWVRGREPGVGHRFALARARLRGATARAAGVAAALIVALGGFVFYDTHVLNANSAAADTGRPQAEYERLYGRFADAPQPSIAAVDLRLDVYPHAPAVDARGSYRLVNRTGAAIDSVHVVLDPDIDARSMSLDRASTTALVDDAHGYRILALQRALAPGDSLRLTFDVAYRPRGFRSRDIATSVVDNGTYFDRRWLPFVGYQPRFELSDGAARKRFGLQRRAVMPNPDDVGATADDDDVRNEDPRVRVETVVSTAADQIAVVPGVLRRSWKQGARRYFHYGTDVPTRFATSVFSARYAVRDDRWHDVALQILHHPAHGASLDPIVHGMKASLDYYTTTFGPYRFPDLRIVEIPPYSLRGGRAFPGAVLFAEDFFITRARQGQFDQAFFGTAHEVAHQWWGGQLRGANVRGRAFLSETLANYSAMLVTEGTFGPDAARQVYAYQLDRYLQRRAEFSRDVPLLDVEDHPHIAYGKGAVAMYTLRDHLGEATVNGVLRRFLEQHRDAGPPYPTSRDLLAELRAVTPDSLRYLLTDLFETVTLWDVKTQRASVRPTGTGAYEVTLDVTARKLRADSVGHETETPMDDVVEIGVFAADAGSGAPLYLKRHRIHGGRQTIRVIVPRQPTRAGIDPFHKLIDRDGADNVVAVRDAPADAQRGR